MADTSDTVRLNYYVACLKVNMKIQVMLLNRVNKCSNLVAMMKVGE